VGWAFGADDYITKPFHRDDLVARINAIVRRSRGHRVGHPDRRSNRRSRYEKSRSKWLARAPDRQRIPDSGVAFAAQRHNLEQGNVSLNHLYGDRDEPDAKIIDVFICKLRKKLASASGGNEFIETLWSRGYTLSESTVVAHTA
jgi:two-component system, cell cycle response regulator CtrA